MVSVMNTSRQERSYFLEPRIGIVCMMGGIRAVIDRYSVRLVTFDAFDCLLHRSGVT